MTAEQGTTPPQPPQTEQLLTTVEELDQHIGHLRDRLARLEGAEQEGLRAVWPTAPATSLVSWVTDWLIPTFRLSGQLSSWETHPAIVSELTALFIGYQAMVDPEASRWDALTWHGHLRPVLERIENHRRARNRQLDQVTADYRAQQQQH